MSRGATNLGTYRRNGDAVWPVEAPKPSGAHSDTETVADRLACDLGGNSAPECRGL